MCALTQLKSRDVISDSYNQLLVRLLSKGSDDKLIADLNCLDNTGWEKLMKRSGRYLIAPLIYKSLEKLQNGCDIPSDVFDLLRKSYLRNIKRNTRLYYDLGIVLNALRDAGIPVIVLKGAHLCEGIYGNIGLRSMSDIDLLLRQSDLMKAGELLEKLPCEYYLEDEPQRLNPHRTYAPGWEGLPIDMHWHLLPMNEHNRIDIDEIWAGSQNSTIADVETLVLSPEHLLLHICLHISFYHVFDRRGLRSLSDVNVIVDQFNEKLNWDEILELAAKWRISRSVLMILFLANQLLGTKLPLNLHQEMKRAEFESQYLEIACERIFYDGNEGPCLTSSFSYLWDDMRVADKLKLALKRLFPSKTEMMDLYSLPAGSVLLYPCYFKRIGDVLARNGKWLWKLVTQDSEFSEWAIVESRRNRLKDWFRAE